MITLYKYLEGHYEEDRDQLLSLVSVSGTKSNAVGCGRETWTVMGEF